MEIEQTLSEFTTRDALVFSLQAEDSFWIAPRDIIVEDGDVHAHVRAGGAVYRARFVVDGPNVTYISMDN
jgi:hypothetical protein